MKTQELKLICLYTDGGQTISQIIAGSFAAFLRRELQRDEKYPSVHESWA